MVMRMHEHMANECPKNEYWVHTFEDMLTCIARLPRIAGKKAMCLQYD